MSQEKVTNGQKINPPKIVRVLLALDEETDEMLDSMTDNRSWLVRKLIRDTYTREMELIKRGKLAKDAK